LVLWFISEIEPRAAHEKEADLPEIDNCRTGGGNAALYLPV
jgi:hypothetical protein